MYLSVGRQGGIEKGMRRGRKGEQAAGGEWSVAAAAPWKYNVTPAARV